LFFFSSIKPIVPKNPLPNSTKKTPPTILPFPPPYPYNSPNKLFPIQVGPHDTILTLKERIWANAGAAIDGLSISDYTLSQLRYQQIIHPDETKAHDILQWNHLFQIDLPEVESFDFLTMSKKETDQLRTSQIGSLLSTNKGKLDTQLTRDDEYDTQSMVSTDDDDDDGFDLSKMLSFDPDAPVNPNDTNLKKVSPAQLYLIKKSSHKDQPAKVFNPSHQYHFFRLCNLKVKGFVTHGYETRFVAAQGYMIYIYKSAAEFLGGKEPLETFHIAGVNVYNTVQRDDGIAKYLLVIKPNDLQLPSPSALSVSQAFSQRDLGVAKSPLSLSTLPLTPISNIITPKSPTAASTSKDEVVFLTPEALAPNEDLICGAFRRDNVSRPPKGFLVITFDDLISHQAMYKFLTALKYQWLLEVSVNCATICERRGYWTTEGIFRQSASAQQLEELKQQLYAGLYVDITPQLNEHTFTGLMKVLVREMADGPLSSGLYNKWLEIIADYEKYEKEIGKDVAAKDPEAAARLSHKFAHGIRDVSKKLPSYVTNYLSFLFPLLHHVASFSEKSKMHYQQLAIVMAPNLITAPIGRESLQQQMDNQRKLNEMVRRILEECYTQFTPVGSNNKPLQNVIIYDLLQPKYLNSILDDFPTTKHHYSHSLTNPTTTPQGSPSNSPSTLGRSSFFTPQVTRSDSNQLNNGAKDDASQIGSDSIRLGFVNTKHFNPNGGLGSVEDMDDDDRSVAGSFYDSNRIVPMPDEFSDMDNSPLKQIKTISEHHRPDKSLPDLPPELPPLPPGCMSLNDSVCQLNITTDDANIVQALNDEEDKQRYEIERQSMIDQQQRELEAEQLEEYKKIVEEKKVAQAKRDGLVAALTAMSPFVGNLAKELQNTQINLSPQTETAILEVLSQLQDLSEMIDYDRDHP
jgi:hypothetical protein